jgi:hypothetical protein
MPSAIGINLTSQFGVKQTSLIFLPCLVVASVCYFDPSEPKARGELAVGCSMVSLNDSGVRVMSKRSVVKIVVRFGNQKTGLVFWVSALTEFMPLWVGQKTIFAMEGSLGNRLGSKIIKKFKKNEKKRLNLKLWAPGLSLPSHTYVGG